MRYLKFMLLCTIVLLIGCTNRDKHAISDETTIDFGDLKLMKSTELINVHKYIKLESLDESLLGAINQIDIYDDKIYVLDRDKTNSLYIFSLDGKFIKKLESKGGGPGEFILPHTFWIDQDGYILILDRMQNRLLKYELENMEFICEVTLPFPSPLSFAKLPGENKYIYYYPLRSNNQTENKLLIVADDKGEVCMKLYDGLPANKILHGNSSNLYLFNNRFRVYPNFLNKVYELNGDSLYCCYSFLWGNSDMPDNELFVKYSSSSDIMKEILNGEHDCIRMLYVYETNKELVVKYYIKKDFYISIYNKDTEKVINTKVKDIDSPGYFPLPIGVYDNEIVGYINPFEINKKLVKEEELLKLLEDGQNESNPILVFYNFR